MEMILDFGSKLLYLAYYFILDNLTAFGLLFFFSLLSLLLQSLAFILL